MMFRNMECGKVSRHTLVAGRGRCMAVVGRAGIRLSREGRIAVDIAVVAVRRNIQKRRLLVAAEGILAAGIAAEAEDILAQARGNCTAAWGSRSCTVGCIGCYRGRTLCVVWCVWCYSVNLEAFGSCGFT